MPRFALFDDDSESDDDNIASSGAFTAPFGQSRYYFDEGEDDNLPRKWKDDPPIGHSVQQALISTHVNTQTTPMKTLVKYSVQDASASRREHRNDSDSSSVEDLEETMQALALFVSQAETENTVPNPIPIDLPREYLQLPATEQRIGQEIQQERKRFDLKHQQTRKEIKALLDKEERAAQQRTEQQRLEEQAAEQERLALQSRREAEERKRREKQEQEAAVAAEQEAAREQERQRVAQQRAKEAKEAEEKRAREQEERAYLVKADKLVSQLKQVQTSVEPFQTSKPMGRRRLEMKKIVNGKVNTLSEDVNKIKTVAADVSAAIAKAKEDDAQITEQLKAGNTEYSSDMAKGKRYLVDLLCAKVIVRVQAEGFNGQRGDGFPLAHMLSIVSLEQKDINLVLEAHIYTVCPTAIPRLPTPSKDATEEELMESLGMQKGSDGNYETFERFLARTEGLISILADIMASEPADHKLLGGHTGAIKWLKRFLSELPSPPISPLPLITAPVLDAFLTGAGHMLARIFPDEFQKCLDLIQGQCVPRLDEGAVGKPSATRLRKTLEGGLEEFKNTLPSRALGELYHGSTATGARRPSSSAPGQKQQQQQQSGGNGNKTARNNNNNNNPATMAADPFGMNTTSPAPANPTQAPAPSPFSAAATPFTPAAAPSPSLFGAPAPSPFGGGSAPAPSPFGGGSATGPAPSPFGGGSATGPAPSPFGGGSAPAPSPFGSATGPAPSPFGSAPAPSPFGGGQAPASTPSPFGVSAPAPSPFGDMQAPAPFGAPAPSPSSFGFQQQAPAPFSTTPFQESDAMLADAPAPFGSSSFGPGMGFGQPQGNPAFGASNASPFGGSPYGGQAPAPGFGMSAAPAPFGATFGQPASTFGSASPFGGPAPASNSPFGGPAPAPTPFSSGNQGGFGGAAVPDNRPPCRFFAKGLCRYGDQCRFSHGPNAGGGNGGGGGNSFSNSFGGGPRR